MLTDTSMNRPEQQSAKQMIMRNVVIILTVLIMVALTILSTRMPDHAPNTPVKAASTATSLVSYTQAH